jgi:hypothetical protein
MNWKGSCLDYTRPKGVNYIKRKRGNSFPNYDTPWISSKGQGEMAYIKLLSRTNFHNFHGSFHSFCAYDNRTINGLISYDLCYIVMMWCIKLIILSKHISNSFISQKNKYMKNIEENNTSFCCSVH